ncbi:MAG: tetratricopeptide repeat protein, partial [Cyanobacteriota bacterium]|nr:tetratricopeptide repeat protein [Cyanobacteriota bacterium]
MTSDIVENYSQVAQKFYQEEKFGKALEAGKKAIELKQDLEIAYQIVGEVFQKRGNKPAAAQAFAKLGEFWFVRGQFKNASTAYRRATQLQPNFPIYYKDLGNALTHNHIYWYNQEIKQLLMDEGCLDEAITCYQKAIDLGFDSFWIYLYLGDALTARDRFDEAANAYQSALRTKVQTSYPDFVEQYWDSAKVNGPDFVIIGAAKCGTTSLYEYMVEHPQIVQTVKKEIDFFLNFDWGLDWYLSHFPPTPKGKVKFLSGEA